MIASNVEGTVKSLKDSGQLLTAPSFTDLVDHSIARRVVSQLGSVKNFPY